MGREYTDSELEQFEQDYRAGTEDCPVCFRNRPGNELEPFPFGELRIRYCSTEHALLPSIDDADPEKVH